mgnify:FL=1
MINPQDINNLNILSREKNLKFTTLAYEIKNNKDFKNANIVKVITKNKISYNLTDEALNFQRIIKSKNFKNIYQHFGIYLYNLSTLKQFIKLEKSQNEINESLEQLRAIDNNMKIEVLLANNFSYGIDTKKDLDEYTKLMNK